MIWHKKLLNDDGSINKLAVYNNGFSLDSIISITSSKDRFRWYQKIDNKLVSKNSLRELEYFQIKRDLFDSDKENVYLEHLEYQDFQESVLTAERTDYEQSIIDFNNKQSNTNISYEFISFDEFFERNHLNRLPDYELKNLLDGFNTTFKGSKL